MRTAEDPRVRDYLASSRVPGLHGADVARLAGDASNRMYFRLRTGENETRILALLPSPFEPDELPFLQVAELFRLVPLRIPEIFEVKGDLGILLLEDLGDNLLQDEVTRCSCDRKRALYLQAVEMLAALQSRGRELESEKYLPFRIAFDAGKFFDELVFFRTHFLEDLAGAELGEKGRGELDEDFHELASELASQPYALCHRDYHSRNLIVGEELAVIDFQDARMGPRCYDLVSLINDSYVGHGDELVSEMRRAFGSSTGADVEAEYDLAALQRNLKALGTFGYQIVSRENDVYRRYVAHTLGMVRANLERNERWGRLKRNLARHLPELG
jgi:aminoglycoside/choline kinase family phosphotransferase